LGRPREAPIRLATLKDETRQRVMEVIEQLNYRPNLIARNLKSSETKMLDMAIPVYAYIIHGAEDQAAIEGYNLLLYSMKKKGLEKTIFSIF